MFKGTIAEYRFEYDKSMKRINVYRNNYGFDPVAFIRVEGELTAKEFDYEIMDWYSKHSSN